MPNALACLALGLLSVGQGPDAGLSVVDPTALTRDPNLIGREVVVDDRILYFLPQKGARTQVFDSLRLKRTEVVFRLPPDLCPDRPPKETAARVTGILRNDGRQLVCDVNRLELFKSDLDRLNAEVKRLGPGDTAGRFAWATWAERRARDFKDAELAARGRAIEIEGLRIDADRPGADDLALARRARSRDLGEGLANALAHRGLRARIEKARSAEDLAKLADQVTSFLPRSADPKVVGGLGDWKARVTASPVSSYPDAPEAIQAALDRALLADILQRELELRLAATPGDAPKLSEEARTKLPDRPELALRFREQGLASSEGGVTSMRLSEVEALARTFSDDGQPDRAKAILKTWLADQRRRLVQGDADGYVILAGQYDRLLNDRGTAAVLLNEALKDDPQLKSAADAFRRMGFRKGDKGAWIDPATDRSRPTDDQNPTATALGQAVGDSLRGMSPEQVRNKFGGNPTRIVRSAMQDATIEQWIYKGTRGTQIVNFRKGRGRAQPEVVANFILP